MSDMKEGEDYQSVPDTVYNVFVDKYRMSDTPVLPQNKEDMKVIFDAYLLEKAIYEVSYELNNRPDWLEIPFHGISQVLSVG